MKPLSEDDKERARNQRIAKLTDLLAIAQKEKKLVIFDLNSPPSNNWKNLIVLFVILSSLANSDEVAKFPFKINLHIFVEDDKTDSA